MTDESAMVEPIEEAHKGPTKRPILVWVILIYYVIIMVPWFAQFGGWMFGESSPGLDARGNAYAWFDYVESLGFVVLKLAAVIALFRLKRIAVKLFFGILALNVVATSYDLVWHGVPERGILTSVVLFIGFGVLGAVSVYAWWLGREGLLR